MPPLGPLVFVPFSLESHAVIARLQQMAADQGKTLEVTYDKVTDERIANLTSDITVFHDIDFGQFTQGGARWTVVPASSLASYLGFHRAMQPDQPEYWVRSHASGAAMGVVWLEASGAQVLRFADVPAGDTSSVSPESVKLLSDIFAEWPIPRGKSWDWRDAFIASSPEYKADQDGWVDLTGRARHILTGPYIFLPAGIWNVVMDFEVDVETGVPRFAFQLGGAALEKTLFTTLIRKSGRYQVSLDAKLDRPDAAHCMVATDAAQLQGFLRLGNLKLTYVSPLEG